MVDETVRIAEKMNRNLRRSDVGTSPASPYDEWSDERLVDGYRRNSLLLREYGIDDRTIQALCAIEERLRARDIDPDRIVEGLDT
ncbi:MULTISPECIES: hypothetical protein [unclassified Haladaptatus]|uniref:hypothetical protein n=1 Tax=unclassified Haladaptatus TaxID=2622732 RepID=UPI00209C47E5|nr:MULTISPECIES: hypothetical protein [unclassified Haladaptatus]MCO8243622.1 hypothetical protein [Haladaptatus sp. AB643]MCO8255031.1 hypothetical protein [Haladaptatus sp. AB618]